MTATDFMESLRARWRERRKGEEPVTPEPLTETELHALVNTANLLGELAQNPGWAAFKARVKKTLDDDKDALVDMDPRDPVAVAMKQGFIKGRASALAEWSLGIAEGMDAEQRLAVIASVQSKNNVATATRLG
jgi:hypothetical protein